MKKILSLIVFAAIAICANAQVTLTAAVEDANLVFKFENTSGKTIANCNFQILLPEGVTLTPKGKKYAYEEGDATEGMTFSVAYSTKTTKYTITVYDGEFDETAGNTIISLPLVGDLKGEATISNIAFGDPDANNICRPAEFKVDLAGTGINAVSAAKANGAIYNLAGQRVNKAQKGIFIQNGVKILK